MDKRIKEEKVNIDYEKTIHFFENRAEKKNIKYLYNRCLYKDNDPELILRRDNYEKHKITPLLHLQKNDMILDIGCGVGRWGETILENGAKYIGVDYSQGFLKLAQQNLQGKGDFKFFLVSFQELPQLLKKSDIHFTKIIVSGCFMYVNDQDLYQKIPSILSNSTPDAMLYLRESIAKDTRLTLTDYYSQELDSDYSAIYRTKGEYKTIISPYFNILDEGRLYDNEVVDEQNETECYFFVAQRKP